MIEAVVSQHVEEAAFLWTLRARAVGRPHFRLRELARLDERVVAHLDGLRVNGDPAWALAKAAAESGAGELFAAAVLAYEDGREERVAVVLGPASGAPGKARALAGALAWLPFDRVQKAIQALLASPNPVLRRAGLAATAAHRVNPLRPLQLALTDTDPALRARAFRAVGELGVKGLAATLRKGLTDADPACRFAAAWSMALLTGDPPAVGTLSVIGEKPGPFAARAAALAARRMPPLAANAWRIKLAGTRGMMRRALLVAGAFGDPAVVPWLIECMEEPPLARPAGEAFSMITGADLDFLRLNGTKPEGFEAGPTDDPGDPNVEMDPDYGLPWPNPKAVAAWWGKNKESFPKGVRHVAGKRVALETCREVLKTAYQRQRAAAAQEMVLIQTAAPLFEVRAPAFRQQKLLAAPP
jgi:uncharacterized protein (TIGR02270 family)